MKTRRIGPAPTTAARPAGFEPADAAFAERVRESFARQGIMTTIGAELVAVAPGRVEIALAYRDDLTQQHGFLHAGVVTTILDSACGYAAFSLMPADAAVLTVEYKVNLLAPARADVVARAHVVKAGRSLTVCAADAVVAGEAEGELVVATMLATMMTVRGRSDVPAGM